MLSTTSAEATSEWIYVCVCPCVHVRARTHTNIEINYFHAFLDSNSNLEFSILFMLASKMWEIDRSDVLLIQYEMIIKINFATTSSFHIQPHSCRRECARAHTQIFILWCHISKLKRHMLIFFHKTFIKCIYYSQRQ